MTFLSMIASVFSARASDVLIEQPQLDGNLSYEIMEMPSGPGVSQLQKLLAYLPPLNMEKGPWLAGGACRRILQGESLDGGDVDLFFRTRHDRKTFDHALLLLSGNKIVHKSTMATTYQVGDLLVQVIKRDMYESLEDLFKDFDFSACQIASDGEVLAGTPSAIQDIKSQTLRFAPYGKVSKTTVINRMSKYLSHGFKPEPGLFKIMVETGLDVTESHQWFGSMALDEHYVYDHGMDAEDAVWTVEVDAAVLKKVYNGLKEKYGV